MKKEVTMKKTLCAFLATSILLTGCGSEKQKLATVENTTAPKPATAEEPAPQAPMTNTNTDTNSNNSSVKLTYGTSDYISLNVSPMSVDGTTLYNVTFSTEKDENGNWNELSFTSRFIELQSEHLFFANYNLEVGRYDALNFYYEINISDEEIFNHLKTDLLNNPNTKNAILTISRINQKSNRVVLLVLDQQKIEALNYPEVTKHFSKPADATINLFELGTVYAFNTVTHQEPITFTPNQFGWRAIVEKLESYQVQ